MMALIRVVEVEMVFKKKKLLKYQLILKVESIGFADVSKTKRKQGCFQNKTLDELEEKKSCH